MEKPKTNPIVSIITPTYNRADLIGQTISSVIAQTYTNWELIIIDDASTDTTQEVVESFAKKDNRIHYIRREHHAGISANRILGIEKASGKYIAMIDSDDIWIDHDKLAKQVAFLESHSGYALVGTQIQTIDTVGTPIGTMIFETSDDKIRSRILLRNQFAQSSVLFSKKAALDVGSYNTSYTVNEDYDFWLALGTKYKFANIPDIATGYRVHDKSIIRQRRLLAAGLHLDIIKKYRHQYPSFLKAAVKGYVRIIRAYFQ